MPKKVVTKTKTKTKTTKEQTMPKKAVKPKTNTRIETKSESVTFGFTFIVGECKRKDGIKEMSHNIDSVIVGLEGLKRGDKHDKIINAIAVVLSEQVAELSKVFNSLVTEESAIEQERSMLKNKIKQAQQSLKERLNTVK